MAKIKHNVKLKSGAKGWQAKLQDNYDNSFDQFKNYCEVYNIHKRLGYVSPRTTWKKNPTIQGGTNPSDFRKV